MRKKVDRKPNKECGVRIKQFLKDNKMTQKQLAIDLGYTQQHITRIVTGKCRLTEELAIKIASLDRPLAKRYTAEYLMNGVDDNKLYIDDNFETVLICAIRYALGRHTYMPHLVMSYIKPMIPTLTDRTLYCLERDIDEQRDAGGYGDPIIDEPEWMHFLDAVRTELKRREDKNGQTQTRVRLLQER